MSLLGIDVGTTGCKAALFSVRGDLLAVAYREYDMQYPRSGWAQLDAAAVWAKIKTIIREVAAAATGDPIQALSVSSLGEAVVPVTRDRRILAPSILNFDVRGQSYVGSLGPAFDDETLYTVNGNTPGNHYGLTKLLWLRDHQPELYEETDKFLLWSSFVAFMLGGEPAVDYTLANRTLLFDLQQKDWSETLLQTAGLDREKLPDPVPSGTLVGHVDPTMAQDLGLTPGVAIISGAHDQCANAVGCAVYGMGTFICITPVFERRGRARAMIARGLNTEHHAVPGRYVSFIYNQGGSLVKWFRDTFAMEEHRQAQAAGAEVYDRLFAEAPSGPSGLVALPHFTTTGPPSFISDSAGVLAGLRLETPRGAILKSLIEGATFYLKACVDDLPGTGIVVDDFRAVGGGSKSDVWVQLSADIMGRPLVRPEVTEAGALGASIIAGIGIGAFATYEEGVAAMVRLERVFEPDVERHAAYQPWFEHYRRLWPLMQTYLQELAALGHDG
jgi:xylulokinase